MNGDGNKYILGKIAEAFLGTFSSIYYVNADTNEYQWYSVNPEFNSLDLAQSGKDFFVNMARDARQVIHPDDPPFPIFGLPRILSSAADIREMARACPSRHVGVTLCTGSLGANLKNDAVKIFREFHERIHFCHFRNLLHSEPGVFRESDSHLVGNTDMPALMFELLKEERRRGAEIVVRPDHGRMLDADKGRTCYYGYSYGGRLIGLSELRGLEAGLKYKPRRGLPKRA